MSSSYKLLFHDRRQFVFEQADEKPTTAMLTLVSGFIAGSLIGVYFVSLDATTAMSILFAIVTYITILTSSFSLRTNPLGVLMIFITSLGAVLLLIYTSRLVLGYFSESPLKLVLVFACLSAIVAELIYLWSRITWVEDIRMHQFIEIERDDGMVQSVQQFKEQQLGAFFWWILEVLTFGVLRLYFYLRGEVTSAGKYPFLFIESLSKWPGAAKEKPITILNESLKRVKICVYHRADYACWIPVGGLTGGMYELERGEELVISPHWPSSSFRVKAFAHGVIDFQLASHPCMVRGRKYAFIDVGKPITLLTGASPPASARTSFDAYSSSSSEDEDENGGIDSRDQSKMVMVDAFQRGGGGLRRVMSSKSNLSGLGSAPGSPKGDAVMTPTASNRKQFKKYVYGQDSGMSMCVGILNESTSDVRVSFFNVSDTSFVISLDGFAVKRASETCCDKDKLTISRSSWKVFSYAGNKPSFCVRVKSMSSTHLEVAYCTVLLGEALVVRDPIVSSLPS